MAMMLPPRHCCFEEDDVSILWQLVDQGMWDLAREMDALRGKLDDLSARRDKLAALRRELSVKED